MLKYNDSAKHIHRPVPCPAYDIYGMESWLEHMAREGYLLSSDGFFLGFADFEVSRPCEMKYRLQAARKPRSIFEYNAPDDDEAELSEAMGWEFVARRGEFHIYRSAAPDAPELNTDPQVQALTLKAVSKRLPNHLISLIIWLVIYPLFVFDGGIVRAAIATGSAFTIFSLLLLIWIIAGELRAIIHIRRVRKQLEMGERPPHRPYSKQKALRHLSRRCAYVVAVTLWIVLIILVFLRAGNAERPLAEFEGAPPFATLESFYPESSDVDRKNFMGIYDNYEYLSDPLLAPESIIWREMADITFPDGSSREVSMILYYHEMRSEALAKIVVREFLREAKGEKYYTEIPVPDIGADFAAAYSDHFESVILRQGSRLIKATLLQYGEQSPIPLSIWAQILAESIKE